MATTYEISTGFSPAKYEVITGTGSVTYSVAVGGRGPAGEDGATEWNQLEGTLDVLPFTTTNGGPQNLGELAWTQADETLSLQLAHGTILQLGEETLYHVENVTGSTIANGTPVSYAGTVGNSGKMRVKPWNGATDDPLIFMGIATSDIETDDAGYVTHFGKVRGINTNAYTAGAVLYANPSGTGLTMTQPTTGQYVIAAVCISSANNGTMFVRPTRYGGANWDAIGGKPSTFAPSAHTHPASEISDSTATGRSLMTAANASAARTTLGLGNAALATTSTGGNGSADSGKVATYGSNGNLYATSFVISYGGFDAGFLATLITTSRGVYFPDANGVMALTASTTGIPDNLVVSSTKTTPVDADSVLMTDSEVAGTPAKRLTFANLWTWITTKLGGNLTIGGTKTWSGQQEATGQAATNGTSLMTRDLGDSRYGYRQSKVSTAQVDATDGVWRDIPGLTSFQLDANSEYEIIFRGNFTTDNNAIIVGASLGSVPDPSLAQAHPFVGSNGVAASIYGFMATAARVTVAGGTAASTLVGRGFFSHGTIRTTSATTLNFQYSQLGSPARTASILVGARAVVTKIS